MGHSTGLLGFTLHGCVSRDPIDCSSNCASIANAVLALLYHPALLTSPNGADTPMSQGMQRSIKLSLTCSRAISESIVFADLGSPISFVRLTDLHLLDLADKVYFLDRNAANNASAIRRWSSIRA
jgi:hypothetical protein